MSKKLVKAALAYCDCAAEFPTELGYCEEYLEALHRASEAYRAEELARWQAQRIAEEDSQPGGAFTGNGTRIKPAAD